MIGVYICHCGTNIAGTVDVEKVTELAKNLSGVSVARNYRYFCSDPGQAIIKKDIADLKLQRVVVASCSPRMHEPTFRGTISQAGLNPYFLEMANIREHCSWVHKDRESATAKAFALIRGAVAKAALLMPLHEREVAVIPAALVVGGGAAGLRAARNIADAGFKVFVVEKEPILGGRAVRLANVAPSLEKAIDVLREDLTVVASHPNIEALTNARVTAVEGYYGSFKVTVDRGQGTRDTGHGTRDTGHGTRDRERGEAPSVVPAESRTLSVGCVIVATGTELFDPRLRPELGYGLYDNVITGFELEQILSNGGVGPDKIVLPGKRKLPAPKNIVLVKCVGSRDKNVGNEYCSRVCCSATAKHALLLKQAFPGAEVTVFYMDVRTFGKGHEEFYDRVREAGVRYRRGNVSEIYSLPSPSGREAGGAGNTNTAYSAEKNRVCHSELVSESPCPRVEAMPNQVRHDRNDGFSAESTPDHKKTTPLIVRAEDTLLCEPIEVAADLVVLAAGMVPRPETNELAGLLKITRGADGFLLEAHPKLRPVDTATDGVFLAGCCQGPKDITDTLAQAGAAAAKAMIPLSMGKVMAEAATPKIDEKGCAGCRICEAMCAYGALVFDEKRGVMTLNQVLCKGCGSCGSACPSSAISPEHFKDEQVLAQVDAVSV